MNQIFAFKIASVIFGLSLISNAKCFDRPKCTEFYNKIFSKDDPVVFCSIADKCMHYSDIEKIDDSSIATFKSCFSSTCVALIKKYNERKRAISGMGEYQRKGRRLLELQPSKSKGFCAKALVDFMKGYEGFVEAVK
ncbi:uncharacterized protein LOC123296283 [Chrysoperla carnea]|uniref:uncharacterized protein LOC123296283 n=1 Tax=Chrysoperla carnea TaxID=189513 RepID=UPI001D05CEED|nr:uncharacterized protein LOC123296283 [Chrysoperla carnea]